MERKKQRVVERSRMERRRDKIQHTVLAVNQCVIKFCTLSLLFCRSGNLAGPEPEEQVRGGESRNRTIGATQKHSMGECKGEEEEKTTEQQRIENGGTK